MRDRAPLWQPILRESATASRIGGAMIRASRHRIASQATYPLGIVSTQPLGSDLRSKRLTPLQVAVDPSRTIGRCKPVPLTTRPSVTVVVPCYNYGRYLPATVASALKQPGIDVNVLIADNGSTDDSLHIANGLAAADERVTVLTQPSNRPYLVNYNHGIDHATSDYIVVLDADDLLVPGSITRSAALMEHRPDVAFTYGTTPRFTTSPPTPRTSVRSWTVRDGQEWSASMYRSGRNVLLSPEVLIRTSLLREVGRFHTDYPVGADLLLWLQLAMRGNVGRINGPDQAFFRIHGQNMHLSHGDGLLSDLRGRRTVFDLVLDSQPPTKLDPSLLRTPCHRALAIDAVRCAASAFDADDENLGEQFADFAVETWPEIVNRREWLSIEQRRLGRLPEWRMLWDRSIRRARTSAAKRIQRWPHR